MLASPSAYIQGPPTLVHDNTVTHRDDCNSPLTVVPAQSVPAEAYGGAGCSSDGVPPRLFFLGRINAENHNGLRALFGLALLNSLASSPLTHLPPAMLAFSLVLSVGQDSRNGT